MKIVHRGPDDKYRPTLLQYSSTLLVIESPNDDNKKYYFDLNGQEKYPALRGN